MSCGRVAETESLTSINTASVYARLAVCGLRFRDCACCLLRPSAPFTYESTRAGAREYRLYHLRWISGSAKRASRGSARCAHARLDFFQCYMGNVSSSVHGRAADAYDSVRDVWGDTLPQMSPGLEWKGSVPVPDCGIRLETRPPSPWHHLPRVHGYDCISAAAMLVPTPIRVSHCRRASSRRCSAARPSGLACSPAPPQPRRRPRSSRPPSRSYIARSRARALRTPASTTITRRRTIGFEPSAH